MGIHTGHGSDWKHTQNPKCHITSHNSHFSSQMLLVSVRVLVIFTWFAASTQDVSDTEGETDKHTQHNQTCTPTRTHIYSHITCPSVTWRLHCSVPGCHGNQSGRVGMGIISNGVCNPGDSCLVTEEREGNRDRRLQWVNDNDKEASGDACAFVWIRASSES